MQNNISRIGFGISSLLLTGAIFIVMACAGKAPEVAETHHGAKLWSDNCSRCHNVRSPNIYSDAQWEALTLHMRIRANLTPEESREILAFLKSAH